MDRHCVPLLLVITLLAMRASGATPESVDDATWAPAPELLKQLDKAIGLKSVSVQPPAGYVQKRHPKADVYEAAGIKVYLWQRKDADLHSPSLTVMLLPPTRKEPWDPKKFIDGFAKSMAREWQNSSTSEFRKGHVGSASAVQSQYNGTTKAGDRVSGFLLALDDAQGTVVVNAMASTDQVNSDLKVLAVPR